MEGMLRSLFEQSKELQQSQNAPAACDAEPLAGSGLDGVLGFELTGPEAPRKLCTVYMGF